MLVALFADIHANREAFSACLAHAKVTGVERYIFLGDYVGYGADPCWVVDEVSSMVDQGAVAIRGNHDEAVFNPAVRMNDMATSAMEWTRTQLSKKQREFLRALPMTAEQGDRLYVHASANEPAAWHYVVGPEAASRNFIATSRQVTVCGHVHVPALYHLSVTGKLASFTPDSDAIPLNRQRRWLAVVGSVGQPRDGNPAAAYTLLDDARNTLTFVRVPYDASTAAAKINAAGLPPALGLRLLSGR